VSYKSTRRQWVKLWVNEWLDGTTRFELTAAQRLLWVDLLALAGRSRFPGFIYAGDGGDGKRVGYPVAYLAGVLQMDEIALNNTMKLLVDKGHITLEESSPECYIIGIVNWEKYQSEYMRQKAYRKVTTKVTNHSTSRLLVEGEGEKEVEGEKKRTQDSRFALPGWIPQPAWDDFIEMRQTLKPKPTEKAKALLVKKLDSLVREGGNAQAILEQSTLNGWKGLFPIKGNGSFQSERERDLKAALNAGEGPSDYARKRV